MHACSQSPVELEKLITFYGSLNVELRWTALTVQARPGEKALYVTNPAKQLMLVDGATFCAVQFHAHGPSEHQLGRPFAGELHIVHQHEDDLQAGKPLAESRLAVLGVLLEEGGASGPHPVLQMAEHRAGRSTPPAGVTYTRDDLLPPVLTARRYAGSLTTGGFEEVVTWIVFETPDSVPGPIYAHLEPPRPLQDPQRRYAIRGQVNLVPAPSA